VHGARQSIAGKGLRGTPGACYTRVILGLPLFRRPPAAKIRSASSTWCASHAISRASVWAVFRATPDERTATSHSALCRSTWPWREGSGERSWTREGIQSVER